MPRRQPKSGEPNEHDEADPPENRRPPRKRGKGEFKPCSKQEGDDEGHPGEHDVQDHRADNRDDPTVDAHAPMLRSERYDLTRSPKRLSESREHHEVGVKPNTLDPSNAKEREPARGLTPGKLALHCLSCLLGLFITASPGTRLGEHL